MARPRKHTVAILAAADHYEPRLAAALERSVEQMRAAFTISHLVALLTRGDVKAILVLLPATRIAEALEPCGAVVLAAVEKGGKLGAVAVKEAVSR